MEEKGDFAGGFAIGFLLGIVGLIIGACLGGKTLRGAAWGILFHIALNSLLSCMIVSGGFITYGWQ